MTMTEEEIEEIKGCLDELEDSLHRFPDDRDIEMLVEMLYDGNTEGINIKVKELLEAIEEAQNALSNIIYFTKDEI